MTRSLPWRSGITSLMLALLLEACAGGGPAAPSTGKTAPPPAPAEWSVRTARLESAEWPRVVRVPAEYAPEQVATIAAEVAGRIEELAVDLGSRVEAGAAVARIHARDYELGVAAAKAALGVARANLGPALSEDGLPIDPARSVVVRQAQTELDDAVREHTRLSGLASEGISAQAELDRATTRLRQAQGGMESALQQVSVLAAVLEQRRVELERARADLARTDVRAPFRASVVERLVNPGDYVARGAGLVRVLRDDPLRLRLRVGEREARSIALGQRVRLHGRAGEEEGAVATVSRLAPAIDARTRTLLAEVDVANPEGRLLAGAFTEAEIVVDEHARALVLPPEAIVSFAGVDKVFVVRDGKAAETMVGLGRRTSERVELLSGLDEGAEVVLAPGRMRSGDIVHVTP